MQGSWANLQNTMNQIWTTTC